MRKNKTNKQKRFKENFLWKYVLFLFSDCTFILQDVEATEIRVQVCVYAFDMLFLNGQVSVSSITWIFGAFSQLFSWCPALDLPHPTGVPVLYLPFKTRNSASFQSLVRKPLSERRALLHDSFNEVEGQFLFATSMDTSNTDEIADFLECSIKGIVGIVVAHCSPCHCIISHKKL